MSTNPPVKARPTTFTIELRPEPGVADPIRALRAVLKAALRRHGLRCVSATENTEGLIMKTAVILNFPAACVEQTTKWLRGRARRRARRIAKFGWRPNETDLAQLRASTRDALAYRTTLRAWRRAGFKTVAVRRLAGRGRQPTYTTPQGDQP